MKKRVPYRRCNRPEEQFQDEVFFASYGTDYFKDGKKGATLRLGTVKRSRKLLTLDEDFVDLDDYLEVILSPKMAAVVGRGLVRAARRAKADDAENEARDIARKAV